MSEQQSKPAAASSFNAAPADDRNRLLAARRHARQSRESRAEGTAERERANDLGGLSLQMSVHGEIPGYHLYWENDENGAIETLLMEGFDFVLQEELYSKTAKVVADEEISSVISRFVKGMRNDNTPLRAYLLKCPEDLWEQREQRRYAAADARDAEIRRQADQPDEIAGMRKLKNLRSSIDTQYRKDYSQG